MAVPSQDMQEVNRANTPTAGRTQACRRARRETLEQLDKICWSIPTSPHGMVAVLSRGHILSRVYPVWGKTAW